ncbi:MAG: family 1 glycosylhydrolase [Acidimicrobiales bacterium]
MSPETTNPAPAGAGRILPEGFRFGVATAAFQIEGGLNGPGEPKNNWIWWENAGRVEPSGGAIRFWDDYEDILDRAQALGCDIFRLGIEWARVEPEPGQIDTAALDRYEAILLACLERGMEPMLTLHHFTHPYWLGDDFWLSSESPDLYARWVRLVADRLGKHVRYWITINEINIVAFGSYVIGIYPPGRRIALGDFNRATGHLVAAHVKGYQEIHDRFPEALVSTNNSSTSTYEYDRLFIDLLLAKASGVARDSLEEWIAEKRRIWYAAIDRGSGVENFIRRAAGAVSPIAPTSFFGGGAGGAAGGGGAGGAVGGAGGAVGGGAYARRIGKSKRASDSFSSFVPAIEAVYDSKYDLTLDAIAIDYYDPVASNHVAIPGKPTAGGRSMSAGGEIWDERVNPAGMSTYIKANIEQCFEVNQARGRPLDLWMVENGMCNRVRRGRPYDRMDLWDRPRYLLENIAAMVDSIDRGMPVTAYLHWTLVDNYEWGSYEPRFGIHGVDRERNLRVMDTDAMGRDAAGTYRRLIKGLREGDRSVLESA